MLDVLIESLENDPTAEALDEAILEMKDNPSKIVSPTGNVQLDTTHVGDADQSEFENEIEQQEMEPEDVAE